jgi:hypothetical protein
VAGKAFLSSSLESYYLAPLLWLLWLLLLLLLLLLLRGRFCGRHAFGNFLHVLLFLLSGVCWWYPFGILC